MVSKWHCGGRFGARNFSFSRYYSCVDTDNEKKSKELWPRLENEPERAHRAFEVFLNLPNADRTILGAYRQHVGNPHAAKAPDTWGGWSSRFAWRERAAAYDDHLASIRREAHEQAIVREAERQAREVEKTRYRMNELMTVAYHRAMECLEDEDWVRGNLRASDVIQIMRLNMEYVKAFEVDPQSKDEGDWTEEDDAEFDALLKEIDPQADLEAHDEEKIDGEDSDDAGREPD